MTAYKTNTIPLTLSILVHVAFGALFVATLDFSSTRLPTAQPEVDIIEAVAVDESKIQRELDALKKMEQRKRSEEDRRQRELESDADRARKQREAEEQRIAELKQKKEQERLSLAELEKKKKADSERAAKEAEQLKKLEAERAALEKKKKEEQQQLDKIALQRKMEGEQAKEKERQEAARKKKEAEDALRSKKVEAAVNTYKAQMTAKIQGLWNMPTNFKPGSYCVVSVKLIPGGEIVAHSISECNADEIFKNSVENAVAKASPLPVPSDPAEFDPFRDFNLNFKPEAK